MLTYLAAIALLFGLMVLALAVDRGYRRFARRHPDCGPFRDKENEHKNCGACKACPEAPTGKPV